LLKFIYECLNLFEVPLVPNVIGQITTVPIKKTLELVLIASRLFYVTIHFGRRFAGAFKKLKDLLNVLGLLLDLIVPLTPSQNI
jgi:hypothetical protein